VKRYEVCIVGDGWAATAHSDAINATRQGRVAAVCSARPLDATALAARYGGPLRIYGRLEEMPADPALDVVDVTSLPSLHRDHAVA
jgi:UDP-N-acetyl-2-amino-2-deoxyglucuronate dehydrogenase